PAPASRARIRRVPSTPSAVGWLVPAGRPGQRRMRRSGRTASSGTVTTPAIRAGRSGPAASTPPALSAPAFAAPPTGIRPAPAGAGERPGGGVGRGGQGGADERLRPGRVEGGLPDVQGLVAQRCVGAHGGLSAGCTNGGGSGLLYPTIRMRPTGQEIVTARKNA